MQGLLVGLCLVWGLRSGKARHGEAMVNHHHSSPFDIGCNTLSLHAIGAF